MRETGELHPPTDLDHNINEAIAPPAPKHKRRTSSVPEHLVDVDQALRELVAARQEIADVPRGLTPRERRKAMIEPLARLNLVKRFIDGVLSKHGWKGGTST